MAIPEVEVARRTDTEEAEDVQVHRFTRQEPDLAVIAGTPDDACEDHPSSAVLVGEVTGTSQRHDRRRKANVYAQAGLPDYWIPNLRLDAVTVLRDPEDGVYRTQLVFHRGERISPLARPEVSIAVEDLLPRK